MYDVASLDRLKERGRNAENGQDAAAPKRCTVR
jgi:hypothetical protein